MENPVICGKCRGSQFVIQKKGYNFKLALVVFILVGFLLFCGWFLMLSNERSINEADKLSGIARVEAAAGMHPKKPLPYEDNYLLWGGTAFILALSLLSGLADANKNQRICLNCGHPTELNN